MKRIVMICALLISAVSFTMAQGGPQGTPEERAQASLDGPRFSTLTLTADQKAKVLPILVAYNKSQTEIFAKMQAGGDRAAIMTELQGKGAEAEKQILAVLTADQKKAYDALLATAKERNPNATTALVGGFGGRGGQGGGGGR